MNPVELEDTVNAMPDGPVRDRLRGILRGPGWEINEAALRLEPFAARRRRSLCTPGKTAATCACVDES